MPPDVARIRIVFRLPSKHLLIDRMFRYNHVMYADTDIFSIDSVEKFVAADPCFGFIYQNGVQVISMNCIRFGVRGQSNRQIRKCFVLALPNLLPPLPIRSNSFHLMKADRSLQIHHIVFKTDFHHLVVLVTRVSEAVPSIFAHTVQR